MSPTVFFIVFLSAACHVIWNALGKRCQNKMAFCWLTLVVGDGLVFLLFVYLRWTSPGYLDSAILVRGAFSGCFLAAYTIFLYKAYEQTDLSVVYPLSRGVAPGVAFFLGLVLLGETITALNGLAIVTVVAGVVLVAFSGPAHRAPSGQLKGILLSCITGCFIAAYHLIDRATMKQPTAPNPIEYLFIIHTFCTLVNSCWFLADNRRRQQILPEFKRNPVLVCLVGVLVPLSYLLIVIALKYGDATNVSAGRNMGIVLSILAGRFFLGEAVSVKRFIGALIITLGVIALVLTHGNDSEPEPSPRVSFAADATR